MSAAGGSDRPQHGLSGAAAIDAHKPRFERAAVRGWKACKPPFVHGWEQAEQVLQRLATEHCAGLSWKLGNSKTRDASVTYEYRCHFGNFQKCPFQLRLVIPRGSHGNRRDFVHVANKHRALIHAQHLIHIEYTSSVEHSGHTECPKVNQGAHPLFKKACHDNPLMYRFSRAQICEWLQHSGLLPDGQDRARIIHACKKWAESESRGGACAMCWCCHLCVTW
jgi:hypothetical protein